MNTGLISSRYARALLMFVDETGAGETVLRQVQVIGKALSALPQLRMMMEDPGGVSQAQKMSLFESALDGEKLAPELESLLRLLLRGGRISLAGFVFKSFERMYYASRGIKPCRLVTASPAVHLEERLSALVSEKTGCKALIAMEVDPDLIGGFVFEVDDMRLDASMSSALEKVRKGLYTLNSTERKL